MENTNDSAPVSTETTEETTETTASQGLTADDVKNLLSETLEPFTADLASLKRSVKKATKETKADTPNQTESAGNIDLVQKYEALALRTAGITKDSERELARKLQEETGKDMDSLLDSKYFQSELESLRQNEANADASTNIKGDGTGVNSRLTAEHWIAKGEYPEVGVNIKDASELPNREERQKIRKALINQEKEGGKFYNQ